MALNVHLLVCIHGLWGNPDNLAELARFVRAKYPIASADTVSEIELNILVTATNAKNRTYDGIDWGAERVADEVQAHMMNIQMDGTHKVSRFSVIGYSLGGLFARYLLGILYTRGFFDDVKPYNFITISTPHVGLPRYPGLLSACFNAFTPHLLSRSGKQLSLVDHWSLSQQPILEVMADNENIFFKALSLFPQINIYANAVNDVMVPYLTGAIEHEDPFVSQNGLEIDLDEQYIPMIKTIIPPDSSPSRSARMRLFSMAFFRSLKPKTLALPVPVLVQLLLWVFTPILLPLCVIYAVTKLSLDSRASRARITDLERSDLGPTTLLNSLHKLERHTDQAVSSLIDTPSDTGKYTGGSMSPNSNRPSLSSKQSSLVTSLNSLSQMRKHLAFIDGVLNSHAVIVCRDVKNIEQHKRGEGVLRHIVDSLVI